MHEYAVAKTIHNNDMMYKGMYIGMVATNADARISGAVIMNELLSKDKLLLAANHAKASIAMRSDHAIAAPKIPKYPTMSQRKRRNGTS